MEQALPKDGWRLKFSYVALAVAIGAVLWFMAAGLGSKYGLWSWQFGLGTMLVDWGPWVARGAIGISVVSFVLALVAAPRKKPFIISAIAVLIAALLAFRLLSLLILVGRVGDGPAIPPIHDIQTDWSEEVVLSEAMMDARGPDSNPVRYGADAVFRNPESEVFGGRLISDIQEAAEYDPEQDEEREDKPYDTIKPLILEASPEAVFEAAAGLVKRRGWAVVTSDEATGILEATHTSTWFGFKDDVAIRIRADGDGTRVDMRSISRVGGSDIGANAKRITLFLNDLAGQRYD